jgi:hypothetical protein
VHFEEEVLVDRVSFRGTLLAERMLGNFLYAYLE